MRRLLSGISGRRAKRAGWAAAVAVWLACVGSTFAALTSFAAAPGVAQTGPQTWPEGAGPTLDPERLTLVMWVHPKCPCTRASARELAELMARADGRVRATVLVATPEDAPADWTKSGIVAEIAAIPGVDVVADHGEAQARFGATTSGEVRLYAPSGARLFAGGITSARGHEGDNEGSAAIEAFARGITAAMALSPTYGCPLAES